MILLKSMNFLRRELYMTLRKNRLAFPLMRNASVLSLGCFCSRKYKHSFAFNVNMNGSVDDKKGEAQEKKIIPEIQYQKLSLLGDFSLNYRYAIAFLRSSLALSDTENNMAWIKRDIEILKGHLANTNSFFRVFINSPNEASMSKKNFLLSLTEIGFHNLTVKFLLLLNERKRMNLLPGIFSAFDNLYKNLNQQIPCMVITSEVNVENESICTILRYVDLSIKGRPIRKLKAELMAEDKIEIERSLKKLKPNDKLVIDYSVRKDLLGGLVIQIENETLNFSIQSQLDVIKKYLTKPLILQND